MAKKKPKIDSRSAALAQAQALKAEQERKRRRNLIVGFGGGGAVLIVVVAVVIFIVTMGSRSNLADVGTDPKGSTDSGALVIGQNGEVGGKTPDNVPVIEVYADYMCPFCGNFELMRGPEVMELAKAGKVKLLIHPLAMLDNYSTNNSRYSTRSANASVTAANYAPKEWEDFHELLFKEQPKEGSEGLTDKQIGEIAKRAGIPDDVISKFTKNEFQEWNKAATQEAINSGIESTPTIYLYKPGKERQKWSNWKNDSVESAVKNVESGKTPDGA